MFTKVQKRIYITEKKRNMGNVRSLRYPCRKSAHSIRGEYVLSISSLMRRQFVVTHTIRETEIPVLLDRWVTNTSSVKMSCPQKKKKKKKKKKKNKFGGPFFFL
jgi:hypothetical protein